MVAGNPRLHDIRAVADIVLRLGPGLAVFQVRVARNGPRHLMIHQFRNIGGGVFQRDLQRFIVEGADAQRRWRKLARADRSGIFHDPQVVGVRRGSLGIDYPAPGEHEIRRSYRHAIGPLMIAQMECPGPSVRRGLPAHRSAWHRLAARPFGRQAHDHVADHGTFPNPRDEGRIEAFDVWTIAAIEHWPRRVVGRRAAEQQKGCREDYSDGTARFHGTQRYHTLRELHSL